jgi:hypothetical protein
VSKDVNRWITPILYCTVALRNQARYGKQPLEIPKSHLIKNLYLSSDVITVNVNVRTCTMLQYLTIDWWSFCDQSTLPTTLTHLTIASPIYSRTINPGICLSSITHVYLINAATITETFWSMVVFPNLTHVVWGVYTLPQEGHLSAFLTPLINIVKLRVIGIQNFVKPNARRALYHHGETLESTVQASPIHNDPRIVVIPGYCKFTSFQWDVWFRGGEDIWETAERLLSESQS